jgi:hypothetical protein
MGDTLTTPKKKRFFPPVNVRDMEGYVVPFVFNNGETINGSSDYFANKKGSIGQDQGFFIVPLTAGAISVQLYGQEDGDTFTIAAAEVTAYTGKPLPYRVKAVFSSGTTVTSMNIVW